MPRCVDLQLNPTLFKIKQRISNCHLFIVSLKQLFPSSNHLYSHYIYAITPKSNGNFFIIYSSPTKHFHFDEFAFFFSIKRNLQKPLNPFWPALFRFLSALPKDSVQLEGGTALCPQKTETWS